MPVPCLAEIGTVIVLPPQSSGIRLSAAKSCLTLSILASGLSILLIATIIGRPADFIILIDSFFWGWMLSSAAITKMAISATLAPRDLMAEKASWPGVSMKVILRVAKSS